MHPVVTVGCILVDTCLISELAAKRPNNFVGTGVVIINPWSIKKNHE
jgi:hypothetical protein